MAESSGLSHPTVQRIWRAFGLQPHRAEAFKLSTDPQLIEEFGSLDNILSLPADKAGKSARLVALIQAAKDSVALGRKLIALDENAPMAEDQFFLVPKVVE